MLELSLRDLCAALCIALLSVGCAATRTAERAASAQPEPAASSPSGQPPRSAEDRFYSEVAGFGLVKPSAWRFATIEMEEANRSRVSLGNGNLDELVRRNASAPLVVVLKHSEPYDKLNPSVKVGIRPLGQLATSSPRRIAEVVVAGMAQSVPSFSLEGEIEDTVVSGLPAAAFRARLTVTATASDQQTDYPVLSRTWLVPRGNYLFMIGMGGPPTGEDVSESEFATILESIEIRR